MTEHILLVDDDADIRTIARMTLEAVGNMRVSAASSANAALEALKGDLPDLVLLDVMMPGTDGTSLLETMRSDPRLAPIPIVFMTARAQGAEIERYLALGAAGFIGKPFDPMTLPDRLRAILARVRKV